MKVYQSVTSLPVPGHWQPPGSSSSGIKEPDIIFDVRIEILTLTTLYLDIHEDIPECDLPTWTWPLPASRISLQRPLGTRYYFWYKNWNPDPNKHIFSQTRRHTNVWLPYLNLASSSLQDQPPAVSMRLNIFFDVIIGILTLTNLYLDICEGI